MKRAILSALLLIAACTPLRADPNSGKPRCAVGDICELSFPLFACQDDATLRGWVDLYVDSSRDEAEAYLSKQVDAGRCLRFQKGDKLRILRYIGMSRIEIARPDDDKRWLMLLK